MYVRCTAEESALEIRVADADMRYDLKGWNSSNIWEQP